MFKRVNEHVLTLILALFFAMGLTSFGGVDGKYFKYNLFDRRHTNTALFYQVTLSELLAKFIEKVHHEKGWWCRLPLNNKNHHYESDQVIPSVSKLLSLPDKAVQVLFLNVGISERRKQDECHAIKKESMTSKAQINSITLILKSLFASFMGKELSIFALDLHWYRQRV